MPTEYLIWWLCDEDVDAIGERLSHKFPKYLREQYQSRHGRPGNGRLWVAEGMEDRGRVAWRRTAMARRLKDYGGIVIQPEDFRLLRNLPGIVTDFKLQRPLEKDGCYSITYPRTPLSLYPSYI